MKDTRETMAKKEAGKGRARSRIKPKKKLIEDSKPRPRSKKPKEEPVKPKVKSKKKPESDPNKIVPPIPEKLQCECGFTFQKMVEETYGSFLCPKCKKNTSLEVEEKIFLNHKNITVMAIAFVLCFLLYFGVDAIMGVVNDSRPATYKLMDENKKTIFEIYPEEE